MQPTVYQKPEIRDANDNIIQQGAFGKNTALANATNDGWIDYVANDLEFLYDLAKDEVVPVPFLPASGQMNKTYLLTTTGVSYRWSGTQWVAVSSSEAVGRAETAATNAQNYANAAQQSADDAQDTADDIAEHLVQIDRNTGGISANSKRIGNIEKLLQGNLYDYQTDSTSAYTKTVPAGAMPYAGLEKLGGKTVVMNQLIKNQSIGTTIGITGSIVDGLVTLEGTATGSAGGIALNKSTAPKIIGGHKYMLSFVPIAITNKTSFYLRVRKDNQYVDTWMLSLENPQIIVTASADSDDGDLWFLSSFVTDTTYDEKFGLLVSDLTLMFGSGNEPTTVEQFREMFPADYYPYNAGELLSAGVTEVVSKKADTSTIATYSVPAEVQALEGYGWSAEKAYNYIDYERKVFVQNVGAVDLGTLTWTYIDTYTPPYFRATISNKKDGVCKAVCSKYIVSKLHGVSSLSEASGIVFNNTNASDFLKSVFVVDGNYTDVATFTSAMNGVMLYYELATPQEIDISAYLTDDNLIEVEAGGTLTFPNGNGDNYKIPVPSTEEYMINLQEAVSNG